MQCWQYCRKHTCKIVQFAGVDQVGILHVTAQLCCQNALTLQLMARRCQKLSCYLRSHPVKLTFQTIWTVLKS